MIKNYCKKNLIIRVFLLLVAVNIYFLFFFLCSNSNSNLKVNLWSLIPKTSFKRIIFSGRKNVWHAYRQFPFNWGKIVIIIITIIIINIIVTMLMMIFWWDIKVLTSKSRRKFWPATFIWRPARSKEKMWGNQEPENRFSTSKDIINLLWTI